MRRARSERIKIIAAVWLLGWAAALASFGQDRRPAAPGYALEIWTTEHGLPQNSVRAIAQTRDGHLWVGTFAGLARFDGVKFTIFNTGNTPALQSDVIFALHEDRQGALWIGTGGSGLVKYAQGRFTAYAEPAEAPVKWVKDIWEDQAGNLFLTADGIPLQFKDARFVKIADYEKFGSETSRLAAVTRDGSLWMVVDGLLRRHRAGVLTGFPVTADRLDRLLHAESRDGSLWFSTRHGLLRFDGERHSVFSPTPNEMFYRDRQGEPRHLQLGRLLGAADEAAALRALNPGVIYAGLEDREGNLWVATNNAGLLCFKRTPVTAYGAAQGLSDDSFTAVVPDGAGGLWLGASQVFHYRDGKFTPLPVRAQGWALHQDRAGGLWVGEYGSLGRFKDGRLTRFPAFDGVPVLAFHEDRAGDLWIGTLSGHGREKAGGLYRYRDGNFTAYRTGEGLVNNDVHTIKEDRAGALWVGTGGGVSRFKDGRFTNYTKAQGLAGDYVRDIHETSDGTLWIATYGSGLSRFRDGRFFTFSTAQGLPDNFLSHILEDGRGNFWISSNRGVIRVNVRELNEVADGRRRAAECVVYGVLDGMKSSECNGGGQPAGARTPDGRLWFPTVRGVVAVDPQAINPIQPPVGIENVIADGQPSAVQDELVIPPGQGRLEVRYTALSFVAPQKVRFRYRLEGYDSEWVEAGARRVAYYTNLPPGRYRFRVIAANNDGVWNETGAALAVRLRPHFYQTGLFYSGCVALVGLLGWGGYRLRVRRLMRRTEELEATVAARTATVVEQNELLARANDGLAKTNEQLNQTNADLAEANSRLDHANADLLATLDRLRLGVVIADAAGVISFVSEEARRLLGASAADAVGRRWVEVFPLRPADAAQLQALVKTPPARRAKLPVELKADGVRRHWVEIEVEDDPREAARKIFCFYDVTEIYDLRSLLDEEEQFLGLIGHSPAMQMIYRRIGDLAPAGTTVLIEGETGVGKELAARALHQAGPRRHQAFIAVNCASLTESMLASQLFGHRRGAFTGAAADHKGLFEEANKGTIFLDEISEIPLAMQAGLLRVLQEREILRLGESRPRRVDVRVLAATNRDLARAVAEGRFREDLFYRICVARISIPPLREHREDIPLLASAFLKQASAATGKDAREISREAMEMLLAYDWPGNVRELKSAVEVAVINCRGGLIQAGDLPPSVTGTALASAAPNLASKQRLQQALEQVRGNRAAAARLLGVSRTTLYRWLKELGME
jgi:transcriptional regulator with PAS, ATPase and Fis domain/ligand-binding sensor domain-containing protein